MIKGEVYEQLWHIPCYQTVWLASAVRYFGPEFEMLEATENESMNLQQTY